MVTLADKLIVTDIDVILRGTWLPVPKYNGTNASQMTHVVYIVKPLGNKIKWKQELKGNTYINKQTNNTTQQIVQQN